MFAKVLIANRGEIARRVIRTCRRLGIATVAVHSDADTHEPHVREADEAVRLGPAAPGDSYLDVVRVLDAAVRTGADAIHPGYGFLSESPDLAEACESKAIAFIGPRTETIRLMGDKAAAKRLVVAAGVPIVPGVDADELDDRALADAARSLGLPVLVKAVAGGGGKGMRLVTSEVELDAAIAGARREAQGAFGDDRLLIERFIADPRHVEVQVFGDTHGSVVHLFERDCSVQRRHQKVVEESPSPAVDAPLRAAMGAAAVSVARAADYVGAGTVEFILDRDHNFHFIEMNTRLQVEHPVTESLTGVDLVEWQLLVAAGQRLPLAQADLTSTGHAVEVRLYAEDPADGFLPQAGRVLAFAVPTTDPGVRVDAGIDAASVVTPHYDPMLAKLVVHAADRVTALDTLAGVLARTTLLGVTSNLEFLLDVVEHPAFRSGDVTTSFLDQHIGNWQRRPAPATAVVTAAVELAQPGRGATDPWRAMGPWRLGGIGGWTARLRDGDTTIEATVRAGARGLVVTTGTGEHEVTVSAPPGTDRRLVVDGEVLDAQVARDGDDVWVHVPAWTGRLRQLAATYHADPGLAAAGGALRAPMPGAVAAVNVAVGQHVAAGEALVVVEAMKMEHPVRSPAAGTVAAVHVAVGESVEADQPLVEVTPDVAEASP